MLRGTSHQIRDLFLLEPAGSAFVFLEGGLLPSERLSFAWTLVETRLRVGVSLGWVLCEFMRSGSGLWFYVSPVDLVVGSGLFWNVPSVLKTFSSVLCLTGFSQSFVSVFRFLPVLTVLLWRWRYDGLGLSYLEEIVLQQKFDVSTTRWAFVFFHTNIPQCYLIFAHKNVDLFVFLFAVFIGFPNNHILAQQKFDFTQNNLSKRANKASAGLSSWVKTWINVRNWNRLKGNRGSRNNPWKKKNLPAVSGKTERKSLKGWEHTTMQSLRVRHSGHYVQGDITKTLQATVKCTPAENQRESRNVKVSSNCRTQPNTGVYSRIHHKMQMFLIRKMKNRRKYVI